MITITFKSLMFLNKQLGIFRPTREFFNHVKVIIAGEGLQILTYAQHLLPLNSEGSWDSNSQPSACGAKALTDCATAAALRISNESYLYICIYFQNVLQTAKDILLWSCTPDAILRLLSTTLSPNQTEYTQRYFEHQCHDDLIGFLKHRKNSESLKGRFFQVINSFYLVFFLQKSYYFLSNMPQKYFSDTNA